MTTKKSKIITMKKVVKWNSLNTGYGFDSAFEFYGTLPFMILVFVLFFTLFGWAYGIVKACQLMKEKKAESRKEYYIVEEIK
jgi:4-hydroxybenzoate polyprenyltransferase